MTHSTVAVPARALSSHHTPSPSRGRSGFSRSLGLLLTIAALPVSLPLAGCDAAVFAAATTSQVVRRGSPAVQRLRDPDLAEVSIPGSIGTLEALLEIKPDDAGLRQLLARSYASYGFGFMEERMERAEFEGAEEADIEYWRERASLAYLRARELGIAGLDMIHGENGGIEGVKSQGLDAFVAHLNRFDDRERDTPLLFWTAYGWARWIGLHRDDVAAIADLAFVTAIADRALALDETFFDHAPIALRAGLTGSLPQQLGGRPDLAKEQFDRAIQLSGRRNLLYLLTEARICAIALQDRALYESLLNEIINFDVDSDPNQRLPNLIAQRRARRYLEETDNFFDPAGTTDEAPEGEVEGEEPSAEAGGSAAPSAT